MATARAASDWAKPHEETEKQRGDDSQREQRIAEQRANACQHHDRQGRVIDVAPVEMVGAG